MKRMPKVGDFVRSPSHDFTMYVEAIDPNSDDGFTIAGPVKNDGHSWEDYNGDNPYGGLGNYSAPYCPPPHRDNDYVIEQGSPKWEALWAEYAAWRLTGDSNV